MIVRNLPPPSEFLILSEGELPTEHGNIKVTRQAIENCVSTQQARNRQVACDFEHMSNKRRNPEPSLDDLASPAFFSIEMRERNGVAQLWATNGTWTELGAKAIGSGGFRWFSPEFRANTDFEHTMDLKKISFTNDPAMHTNPKLLFSIGNEKMTDKKKPDENENEDDDGREHADLPLDYSADAQPTPSSPTGDGAALEPHEDSEEEPDPEYAEDAKYHALMDTLHGLLDRVDLPEDVTTKLHKLAGIVAELLLDNQEEGGHEEEQQDGGGMSAEKKILSIVVEKFGELTPAQLEAKLFSIDLDSRESNQVTEIEEKQDLLLSCIEKGQISPYNKPAHKKFLTLSIDAIHEFARTAPSIKTANSIQKMVEPAKLAEPKSSEKEVLLSIATKGIDLFTPHRK